MLTPIPIATVTGKQLRVDSVNGVDASARPYLEDLPYRTLAEAQTDALEGDTILVGPGAYTLSAFLGKNGVSWEALAGVTVTYDSANTDGVVDDNTSAMNFSFVGTSILRRTSPSPAGIYGVRLQHADSNISVKARQIWATTPASGTATCVYALAGELWVDADSLFADGPSNGIGVWWDGGSMNVRAHRIESVSAYGFYADVQPAADAGEANVTCNELIGQTAYFALGQEPTAAAWINALTVRARGTNAYAVASSGAIRSYVVAQKIFGPVVCSLGSGLVYVQTIKWSAIQDGSASAPDYPAFLRTGASFSGTVRIQAWDVDPVTFTGPMFKIEGGTVEIRGMRYIANSGSNGIVLNDGVLRLVNCYIDTSANSGTFPVTKEGGTLELIDTVLISATGVNVIEASTFQLVTVRGSSEIRGPLNANVMTITGASPAMGWLSGSLAVDQNNFNPGHGDFIRISAINPISISGLLASLGAAGGPKCFINIGANNITFLHESGLSDAANRFITETGGSVVLLPNKFAGVTYDMLSQRWRVIV